MARHSLVLPINSDTVAAYYSVVGRNFQSDEDLYEILKAQEVEYGITDVNTLMDESVNKVMIEFVFKSEESMTHWWLRWG